MLLFNKMLIIKRISKDFLKSLIFISCAEHILALKNVGDSKQVFKINKCGRRCFAPGGTIYLDFLSYV
jgi:hypothetical protein